MANLKPLQIKKSKKVSSTKKEVKEFERIFIEKKIAEHELANRINTNKGKG